MKNVCERRTRPRFSALLTDLGILMTGILLARGLLGDPAVIERRHFGRDLVERVFDGEVTGVQSVHLSLRQGLEVGLAAFRREENVVLAPEDDRLRLALLQEGLPFRVELDV